MGAVKKGVLFIFYIIRIAQVTSREGIVSPGHGLNSQGVGTKSEASHATNDIMGHIKKHVFGKSAGRPHHQRKKQPGLSRPVVSLPNWYLRLCLRPDSCWLETFH